MSGESVSPVRQLRRKIPKPAFSSMNSTHSANSHWRAEGVANSRSVPRINSGLHHSPLTTHHSITHQPITHHSSLITHHSSLITHHSSLITHHSSLITHHSSLITHHSSLITHHSSLITHHSS